MRIFLRTLLIFFIILIVALLAAPTFVRQDQIRSFIEKRVELPDNAKLELEGDIDFSIFPRASVGVPKASIVNADGSRKVLEDFSFNFSTLDLFDQSIDFTTAFKMGNKRYSGSLHLKDQKGFLNNGTSPIVINMEEPMRLRVKGVVAIDGNDYTLNDFTITHKQTTAKGNAKVSVMGNDGQSIALDTVITSKNIEDIRRLIEFGNNKSDFNLLSGSGEVELKLTTIGKDATALKANLNGAGKVKVEDAAIYGIDLNELIGAPEEIRLMENEDKKIDVKEANATFNITSGSVNISEFFASNQFANITGHGIADLNTSTLRANLDIDADVASARVKIPLAAVGPFDNIRFTPRVGDALIGNIQSITNAAGNIQLKDLRIKLDGNDIDGAVKQIRDLGRGFGLDLDKVTGGATKGMGAEPATPAVPAQPAAPAEPQTPASINNAQ